MSEADMAFNVGVVIGAVVALAGLLVGFWMADK